MAKLTGMVNIAVFAAFRCVITVVLRSNAEFKPICAPHELDVLRYGWQKRQDRGKKWQRCGNDVARSAAKTARVGARLRPRRGHIHATMPGMPVTDCQSVRLVGATRLFRRRRRTVTPRQ